MLHIEPLLKSFRSTIDLTEDEISLIDRRTVLRKYLKGQYIVQQGDFCNTTNFIISGCTKTFVIDEEGQEHIIMFSIENWWTSDLGSFVSRNPADYHIQCMEPTEVIQFTYENLQLLYQEVPKLNVFFRILLEKALVAAQKRIIRNFSLTAKERYLAFKSLYPEIDSRIPQYMIASYLGITKEFLSKIKSQLILEQ
ncbi:Crp/Fnr family transcriptional regulator [Namhaeicola litoreus]|uniref:Crp/Fnr family transcriptional regulator n=1 Tax=Namhaeicola litoreus TaxID=1052145 RepID=A0ABW3Y1V6_9FLAO